MMIDDATLHVIWTLLLCQSLVFGSNPTVRYGARPRKPACHNLQHYVQHISENKSATAANPNRATWQRSRTPRT